MAARVVTVVAKSLLSEEAESVVKTAARMIRTTVLDESGVIAESTGMSMESVTMESGALHQPKVPEFNFGNTPREIELPGSKSAPEITPGQSGKLEQKEIKSPLEVPETKTEPEIKTGEIDVAEEVSKSVPTDPEALIFTVEQGRKEHRPEIGEKRTVFEIDENKKQQQESTENGQKTEDVGRKNEAPEVGSNLRDGLIN